MNEVWIIDGLRSPRGLGKAGKGSLSHLHPQRCLAQVLQALQQKVGFDPADVEDVIMGNGDGSGKHGMDIARMSALDAGWPTSASGVTLNRFCGSGQQAINFGAMSVMSGQQDLVVAGGVEFMSLHASATMNFFHAGNDALLEKYPMVPQGISADLISAVNGFTREDCDKLAEESQRRAANAITSGYFERSLVPIYDNDGSLLLDKDEIPRPGTTLEVLSQLKPSFVEMGDFVMEGCSKSFKEMALSVYPQVKELEYMHHAGNSSAVADGASALLLCSPSYAKAHGLKPRAKIKMTAVAGNDPVIMLTAPGPAAKICLQKAGMTASDIDLWEVNEAFASVVLKFNQDLGITQENVNIDGGAIALGHPIGATGGILIQTVLDALEREDKTSAMIAMCTGGGMGTATIIERM